MADAVAKVVDKVADKLHHHDDKAPETSDEAKNSTAEETAPTAASVPVSEPPAAESVVADQPAAGANSGPAEAVGLPTLAPTVEPVPEESKPGLNAPPATGEIEPVGMAAPAAKEKEEPPRAEDPVIEPAMDKLPVEEKKEESTPMAGVEQIAPAATDTTRAVLPATVEPLAPVESKPAAAEPMDVDNSSKPAEPVVPAVSGALPLVESDTTSKPAPPDAPKSSDETTPMEYVKSAVLEPAKVGEASAAEKRKAEEPVGTLNGSVDGPIEKKAKMAEDIQPDSTPVTPVPKTPVSTNGSVERKSSARGKKTTKAIGPVGRTARKTRSQGPADGN